MDRDWWAISSKDLLGMPTAQRTAFGWIIMGLAPRNADIAQVSHYISDGDTNSLLRKFWEDEEIQHPLSIHPLDLLSLKLFLELIDLDPEVCSTRTISFSKEITHCVKNFLKSS